MGQDIEKQITLFEATKGGRGDSELLPRPQGSEILCSFDALYLSNSGNSPISIISIVAVWTYLTFTQSVVLDAQLLPENVCQFCRHLTALLLNGVGTHQVEKAYILRLSAG